MFVERNDCATCEQLSVPSDTAHRHGTRTQLPFVRRIVGARQASFLSTIGPPSLPAPSLAIHVKYFPSFNYILTAAIQFCNYWYRCVTSRDVFQHSFGSLLKPERQQTILYPVNNFAKTQKEMLNSAVGHLSWRSSVVAVVISFRTTSQTRLARGNSSTTTSVEQLTSHSGHTESTESLWMCDADEQLQFQSVCRQTLHIICNSPPAA